MSSKEILKSWKNLWNWKTHPGNVFILVWPLVVISLGLLVFRSWLEIRIHGDYTYLIIILCFTPLFMILGHAIRRLYKLFP